MPTTKQFFGIAVGKFTVSRDVIIYYRFPGNLCRDPGNFFYFNKGFSGADNYHSDTKYALGLLQI